MSLKSVVKNMCLIGRPRWPVPSFSIDSEPHFLFIITPPFSGSTALAKVINTSVRTMLLSSSGEGQWRVPGLCEDDRWDDSKEVEYTSVRAVWLRIFEKEKRVNPKVDVVIEKSPPNMMRIDDLAHKFQDHSFLANNRNPYANCSSIFFRNHKPQKMIMSDRRETIERLAKGWVMRSHKIMEIVKRKNIPMVTYEDFCESPSSIISNLDLPEGVSDTIDVNARVQVKDYKEQVLSNQNKKQISRLSAVELSYISDVLKSERELLEFFNYEILS